MLLKLHLFIYFSMSIIQVAKIYMTVKKKRMDYEEKKINLIIDSILAIIFIVGFIDMFLTIQEVNSLIEKIRLLL